MKSLAACLAVAVSLFPALGRADALHCQMSIKSADAGFIAPDIFVVREGEASEVLVLDGLIHNYNQGQPVQGKVTEDSKSRLVVSWTLKAHVAGTSASVRYRLSMKKADKKVTVTATALGYRDQFTTSGVCQKAK